MTKAPIPKRVKRTNFIAGLLAKVGLRDYLNTDEAEEATTRGMSYALAIVVNCIVLMILFYSGNIFGTPPQQEKAYEVVRLNFGDEKMAPDQEEVQDEDAEVADEAVDSHGMDPDTEPRQEPQSAEDKPGEPERAQSRFNPAEKPRQPLGKSNQTQPGKTNPATKPSNTKTDKKVEATEKPDNKKPGPESDANNNGQPGGGDSNQPPAGGNDTDNPGSSTTNGTGGGETTPAPPPRRSPACCPKDLADQGKSCICND